MASDEFEKMRPHLKPGLATPGDSVADVRRKMAPFHGGPAGPGVVVESTTAGGVPCVWVSPERAPRPDRVLVFFHGGAFVSCSADDYVFYAARFARVLEARVLTVGYRLAPEHRFPAALDDCAAAYRGIVAGGVPPSRVAFIGDSCGGGFVVGALLRLRDSGDPLPACGAALGGWFDLEASGDAALHPVALDPFFDPRWLRERARDYVGPKGNLRDPLASPIHADLSGLPPLFLQVGQVDGTRDDAVRIAARAGRDGVAVTLEVWPEMIHGFQGLYDDLPEARAAVAHVRDFVHARIPGLRVA